jgi:hypothetical protein
MCSQPSITYYHGANRTGRHHLQRRERQPSGGRRESARIPAPSAKTRRAGGFETALRRDREPGRLTREKISILRG